MSVTTAKIYTDDEGQHLNIPPEFELTADEVYLRKDPGTGNLVISVKPQHSRRSLEEMFKAIDEAEFPDDFLADRDNVIPDLREKL